MHAQKRVAFITPTHLETIRGVVRGLAQRDEPADNWNTFIEGSDRSLKDPSWLFSMPWDGVIYNHPDRTIPRACRERGIPCVDISDEAPALAGVPKVKPDNEAIGRLAASHFLRLGFRAFAFCGYSNQVWSTDRGAGFASALYGSGRDFFRYESEHPRGLQNQPFDPKWEETEISAIASWLAELPTPVGILACDDARALHVLKATRAAGLKSPNEVATLGVNNQTYLCELSKPSLSSVDLNGELLGRQVRQLLQRLMDQPGYLAPSLTLVPPHGVVTRLSTNAFAIEDKILAKALKIIRENACKGLKVDDLVRQVHTSRRKLERRFQKCLGIAPNTAIREAQIARIKELLSSTELSLAEIAYATGFEHPEYMNVVFKRLCGITPGRYRDKHFARA